MTLLFSNNAQTTIAGSITNVATSVALAPGSGVEFPAPGAGQTFLGTFNDAATGLLYEIVSVTARIADTLTIVRAQEGTTGLAWNAGDIFGNFMTAGTAADFVQLPISSSPAGGGLSVVQTYAGNPNTHVAGNAGVAATSAPDIVWDTTDGAWWTCITTGTTSTAVWERQPTPVAGSVRNLSGSSAGGVKTAVWTADQIIAANALTGATYLGTSLTLNFNGAGTGANGMDTGATPTTSALYIYAIYNPATQTWACLGTVSGTGATVYPGANMPAGYTASCLIWAGETNGSGQIRQFQQYDRSIFIAFAQAYSNSTLSGTPLEISAATIIPPNAKWIGGELNINSSVSNTIYVAGDSALVVGRQVCATTTSTSGDGSPFGPVPIITSQNFWAAIAGSTATCVINISSYGI